MARKQSRDLKEFTREHFRGVSRGVGICPERHPGVITAWNAEEEREWGHLRRMHRGVGIRPERQSGVIDAWNVEEKRG